MSWEKVLYMVPSDSSAIRTGKNGMMATLNNVAQNLLDSNGSETNGEMETLRKLKDLLDAGVITQDEFETKA